MAINDEILQKVMLETGCTNIYDEDLEKFLTILCTNVGFNHAEPNFVLITPEAIETAIQGVNGMREDLERNQDLPEIITLYIAYASAAANTFGKKAS